MKNLRLSMKNQVQHEEPVAQHEEFSIEHSTSNVYADIHQTLPPNDHNRVLNLRPAAPYVTTKMISEATTTHYIPFLCIIQHRSSFDPLIPSSFEHSGYCCCLARILLTRAHGIWRRRFWS
jgi:hypothetical protein